MESTGKVPLALPTSLRLCPISERTVHRPRCDAQSNYFLFVLIQGRIHQIEYAMEAVKQGSATVGLKSRTHAVLVALKVRTARILKEKLKILDCEKQINALCEIH